jgi:hypothetical protein
VEKQQWKLQRTVDVNQDNTTDSRHWRQVNLLQASHQQQHKICHTKLTDPLFLYLFNLSSILSNQSLARSLSLLSLTVVGNAMCPQMCPVLCVLDTHLKSGRWHEK